MAREIYKCASDADAERILRRILAAQLAFVMVAVTYVKTLTCRQARSAITFFG